MLQTLIVAVLVIGCSTYAVWTLMPAAARRAVAATLLKWPLPDALAASMRRAASSSSGCGCDGCDRKPAGPAAATRPVTFHARPPR